MYGTNVFSMEVNSVLQEGTHTFETHHTYFGCKQNHLDVPSSLIKIYRKSHIKYALFNKNVEGRKTMYGIE